MKTSILGLRTAIYHVNDLQAAKAWYTRAFGVGPYFDEPFYIGFEIGGYELGLQPEENAPADKPQSVVVFWGVEDISAEYARFLEAGATAHEEPNEVGEGIWVGSVKDPWGNPIGLIKNPHFKTGG